MSYVRIWVHMVFSTKNREADLSKEIRDRLIPHIISNARAKDVVLESIGGWFEHLHLLISLGREQTIAKVAMLLKGESAHWLNQQKLLRGKFYWQDDYFAVSVSESRVAQLKEYIANQEEHHRAKSFAEEYDWLKKTRKGDLG
ncbi:MAG: IS200/IS605 family transposase [Pyrinomonadaceae bacterium]